MVSGAIIRWFETLSARVLPWQRQDRCHFASFVTYSPDAKFEEHRLNISRDILDRVLYHFSETTYDVITLLTKTNISRKRKKIF